MAATGKARSEDSRRTIAELRAQLAERTAECDAADAQQAAIAEVLQTINASPGDLAPVFEAILEKAHALCGADRGALVAFDGEVFRAAATRGLPPAFDRFLRGGFPRVSGHAVDRLFRGEPVHIHDLPAAAAESPPELARVQRRAAKLAGTRTIVMVPLCSDANLLGYIAAYRMEVRPFTDRQIALLQNFAAQAVIAMENARLLTETREALEQQTATAEVLQVINSSPGDLAPVFEAMLERAARLCEADTGLLFRFENGAFFRLASHGVSEDFDRLFPPDTPVPLDPNSIPARMIATRSILHVRDPREDESYRLGSRDEVAAVEAGIRTVLFVPLIKEGEVVGHFTMHRMEVKPFTEKQIALLENFAAQAVIAMENARLLGELRERNHEIAGWNRELEARVAAQLAEIERTGKLRRFLAPQLAELIVAQGDDRILESHRREIVVVFCDLRGFTAFAERVEPEEVMALLRDYHAALGPIVARFEGTIDHYGGDGIMVFFNDPLPTPEPARRAIDMALAMREAAAGALKTWRRRGHDIGFGVGIAQGYATLGQIGFAERMDYTAIGTVTNLAARLCAEARDGQILISRRVAIAVEGEVALDEVGDLSLKGLSQAVAVYNVAQ